MDNNTDALIRLREQILEQALPLLDTDDVAPEERFALTLQMAQTKGSLELYEKAFSIAQSMEGEDRLSAYLDLLGEVDAQIQEVTERNYPSDSANASQQNADGQQPGQ